MILLYLLRPAKWSGYFFGLAGVAGEIFKIEIALKAITTSHCLLAIHCMFVYRSNRHYDNSENKKSLPARPGGNCMRNQLTNPGEPIRVVFLFGWIRTGCKLQHKYYTNVIERLRKC